MSQLPKHLFEPDLKRVHAAMRLRHDFIKTHLPKMGLILLAVLGTAAVIVGGQKAVAHFLNGPDAPSSTPPRDAITHMAAPSTPAISSPPSTTAKDRVALTAGPLQVPGESTHNKVSSTAPVRKVQSNPNLNLPVVGDVTVTATHPALNLPTIGVDVKAMFVSGELSLPVLNQVKDQTTVVTPDLPTPKITPQVDSKETPTITPSNSTN